MATKKLIKYVNTYLDSEGVLFKGKTLRKSMCFYQLGTQSLYKNSADSAWQKLCVIKGSNKQSIIIDAISDCSSLNGRGNFKLRLGIGENNAILDLEHTGRGIYIGSFDFRQIDTDTYELWFWVPQWTEYKLTYYTLSEWNYSNQLTICSNNLLGTPTGIALTKKEPYNDYGWQTLSLESSFENMRDGDNPCRCRQINNQVFIEGVIKKVNSNSTIMFYLPADYRPKYQYPSWPVRDGTGTSRVYINKNSGALQYEQATGDGSEISLFGISFFID